MTKLFQALAQKIKVLDSMEKNEIWDSFQDQEKCLEKLQEKYFPHGSGFDRDPVLNMLTSNPEKLIIDFAYHCMDDNGYYDRWITAEVQVCPSLVHEFNFKINWRGYNGKYKYILKDYFEETWANVLDSEIPLIELKVKS